MSLASRKLIIYNQSSKRNCIWF